MHLGLSYSLLSLFFKSAVCGVDDVQPIYMYVRMYVMPFLDRLNELWECVLHACHCQTEHYIEPL